MSLKYRISNIGWYNFELLVQTLLKEVIGPGVTSFGGSKDQGRDAEFIGSAEFPTKDCRWAGKWIFQVKYVDFEEQGVDAARSSLKATLRNELRQVLSPEREADNYILLTDVPLTAQTRTDLKEVVAQSQFSGNFAIVDGKEICQFLDIYGDIRRSYPQLLGLADLDVIVNRDLYARSQAYLQDWQPKLSTYVQTEAHTKAMSLLKKKHFIVLDGPPEAGKTTIAAALALIHAADGFEIIDVRSPTDVFRVSNEKARSKRKGKRRLFVADDAIGSISLVPARADEWSRDLPGILRQLNKDRLLIWTARRYVLEEALATSRLREAAAEFPRPHEVLVEVGSLSTMQKAQILYNHAKQAGLSAENRKLIRDRASQIVFHPNFSPLRMKDLTSVVLGTSKSAKTAQKLWKVVETFLDNPGDRWIQAFRALSQSEQTFLSAMLDFDGPIPTKDLRARYELRVAKREGGHLSFEDCVKRLDHSFITISSSHSGDQYIAVQHPSLRDMLLLHLRGDADARRRYIALANPFGLAGMIGGIAEMFESEATPQHSVVPSNDEEFEVFLDRLRSVSQGVLTFKDWELLLTASERLIPRKPESAAELTGATEEFWELLGEEPPKELVKPVELDLAEFANGWKGKIIGAVLQGFSSNRTIENSQRFQPEQWLRLLTRFYSLTGYFSPPIYPSFTARLCDDLSTSVDSLRLASLVNSAEPLVAKQKITNDILDDWKNELDERVRELVVRGEELSPGSDPSEFDEWRSESEKIVETVRDFRRWGTEPVDQIEELQRVIDSASRPPETEIEDVDEAPPPTSGPYWTLERLFEDL